MSAPYYGYGPISKTASDIITSLFPPAPSAALPVHAESPPSSCSTDDEIPCLVEYIAYALFRTRLPDEIVYAALLLLTRLKEYYPGAKGTPTSPHRLFISSLMLSSKMSMDDTYSNKSWVIVAQDLFELTELNRMERELFSFLRCNCCITGEELEDWRKEWCPTTIEPRPSKRLSKIQSVNPNYRSISTDPHPSGSGSGTNSDEIEDHHDHDSLSPSSSVAHDRTLIEPTEASSSSSPESSIGIVTPSSPSPHHHSRWLMNKNETKAHVDPSAQIVVNPANMDQTHAVV